MGPLTGRVVGVTAARRGEQLADALRRRGATVRHGPALAITGPEEDADLRRLTERLVAAPPDVLVATTGTGMRGWTQAAERWGLSGELLSAFGRCEIALRGAKTLGAVRGLGLAEAGRFGAAAETVAELRSALLAAGVAGRRIALQSHGTPMPELVAALRAAGAEVVEVLPYRIGPPEDPGPLDELLAAACAGRLDAVTFTSAAAVTGTLRRASATGHRDTLVTALRGPVLPACVGPVTAAPLRDAGVPATWPERFRTAALVALLVERLGEQA